MKLLTYKKNKNFGITLLTEQHSKSFSILYRSHNTKPNCLFLHLIRNLIDISSAQTDPLQDTDVQERETKYRHLLDQIQPPPTTATTSTLDTISTQQNILEILTTAKPNGGMTDGEVDWLYQTMDEIQDALQHIDIEPVGDMVVHLTMTTDSNTSNGNNNAIKAY